MGRPTIDDVALHSGYSVATVSRAIRGLPNVSPATRERVLESAQTLRYQPDANAAGLATGKTGIVAMAVMAISSWYTSQVMAGAEAELSASGLDLSVMLLSDVALRRARSDHRSISRRSDGLILLDFVPDSGNPDPTFPTVVVGEHSKVFDSVAIDNVAGGRMAGQHLLQRGHRQLAVIAGSKEELSQVGKERLNGFLQIVKQFDIDSSAVSTEYGNFSALGGYEAMSTILSLPDEVRPTAVFALSDDMAIGALRAAKDLGVRVPEDLSLVGFDDQELAFGFGLTTVSQEPGTLGAVGAKMLLDRFEGMTNLPRSVECPIKLVVRGSTRNLDS